MTTAEQAARDQYPERDAKWVSHAVSVRAASGAIVITTQKGRTQQEAQRQAEQFFQSIGVRNGR